jgi:hypothetical protein
LAAGSWGKPLSQGSIFCLLGLVCVAVCVKDKLADRHILGAELLRRFKKNRRVQPAGWLGTFHLPFEPNG